MGLGLIVAPLVVFFRDLERAVKLILRFLFYASPIIYSLGDVPSRRCAPIMAFNPLAGIFSLYRAAFFPGELDWYAVIVGTVVTLVLLAIGIVVFKRTERAVSRRKSRMTISPRDRDGPAEAGRARDRSDGCGHPLPTQPPFPPQFQGSLRRTQPAFPAQRILGAARRELQRCGG